MTKKIRLEVLLLLVILVAIPFMAIKPVSATTYQIVLHGPYYDDGTVVDSGTASIGVLYVNGAILRFNMTNIGMSANTTTISSSTQIQQVIWLAVSGLNYTRVYDVLPTTVTDELWIHVPGFAGSVYIYTFNVADLGAGMTNPYLEDTIYDGSNTRAVERYSLASTGIVTFSMVQFGTYGLTFRCDQGTFTQSFTAQNTFTNNLQVVGGLFEQNTTAIPTASAVRTTATSISVSYTNPNATTDWLYIKLFHKNGATFITDYENNETTNNFSLVITVNNTTDYYVMLQANIDGAILNWKIPCPILTTANPFTGLFDFLGTFPEGIDPAQLLGAFIILMCLGVGSFRSTAFSCIFAWIIGCVLAVMGWWTASVPTLAFAGFVSILVAIQEAKEQRGGSD